MVLKAPSDGDQQGQGGFFKHRDETKVLSKLQSLMKTLRVSQGMYCEDIHFNSFLILSPPSNVWCRSSPSIKEKIGKYLYSFYKESHQEASLLLLPAGPSGNLFPATKSQRLLYYNHCHEVGHDRHWLKTDSHVFYEMGPLYILDWGPWLSHVFYLFYTTPLKFLEAF